MERPEIDRSVQRGIVDRISAPPARSGGGVRLALAGVLTAGGFGAMAAFGGVSYATNSVRHSVGVGNNNKGWSYTPSCDQYGKQGKKHGGKPIYTPPIFNKGGKGGSGGYFGGFGW
ncbi:MAG: hypothetical protein ABJB93_08000 [Gaiellales bacterium]